MSGWDGFLKRQGQLFLNNDFYAYSVTAFLSLFPFASWIAIAIVCFITLRKGIRPGLYVFLVSIGPLLLLSLIMQALPSGLETAIVNFLPCYLAACLLRITANWNLSVFFIVVQVLLGMILVYLVNFDLVMNQYQALIVMVKALDQEIILNWLNNQSPTQVQFFAAYLWGIQGLTVALAAVTSLMMARSLQARMFYPGGFKTELLNFQGNRLGVILLAIAGVGALQKEQIALSCLPLLAFYYFCTAVSLVYNFLSARKNWSLGVLILLLLIILPVIIFPTLVLLGCIDSFLNLRKQRFFRLNDKTDKRL